MECIVYVTWGIESMLICDPHRGHLDLTGANGNTLTSTPIDTIE
jgi:hypothetical protein